MAKTVAEIMHPDFFHASQSDSIGQVLQDMAELGIGAAPVLDLAGHPLGMATVLSALPILIPLVALLIRQLKKGQVEL